MFHKPVDTYPSTIKCVPECFITHEMCDKAVNSCFFVFHSIHSVLINIKLKECVMKLLIILSRLVCYKKMIKKLYTALYAGENILYFNEDSGNVIFSCNEIGILNIDLNNINLDNNFDEDDPETIILIRLLAWHIKFEKAKNLKKDE